MFRSVPCLIISFASGFLIDLDHIIDYYLHTGINFRIFDFFKWCGQRKFEYISVLFHSLELLILLWGIIYVFGLGNFWIALAIGFSQHMVFDLIFNRKFLKTHYLYFLTIRAMKGFRYRDFLS